MTELLFIGAFAQLVSMALQHGGFKARPKRLVWVLPLMVATALLGLLAATDHNHEGRTRLVLAIIGYATLLFGMASYLLMPRSQG